MFKILFAAVLLAAAIGAQAQGLTNGQSAALTGTSTAVVSPGNIGNPIITFQGAQAPNAVTAAKIDYSGQPVASAAPVYVNSPSPATCVNAGFGGSLQGGNLGGALSIGGGANVPCDAREGAKTAKFLGLPDVVAQEIMCDVPEYRAAFKRAGLPCSADKAKPVTTSSANPGEPVDPFVRQRLGLPPL